MSVKDHFPKTRIDKPIARQSLEGYESVDEYLARGGTITCYPSDYFGKPLSGKKMTVKENRDRIRMDGIARSKPK